MQKLNVAIAGVTGNVGYELCRVLEENNFPVLNFYPIASQNSKGKLIQFQKKQYQSLAIEDVDFGKIDLLFNAAGSNFSKTYVEDIAKTGCVVIDKASYFRERDDIVLSVPEVNEDEILSSKNNIFSVPNCVAIPSVCVLHKLNQAFGVDFVNMSTYQSVSGAGRNAMQALYDGTKKYFEARILDKETYENNFANEIPFNCIPKIGEIEADGYTAEERKIRNEIKKILKKDIGISVTSVRVAAFRGHGVSMTIGLEEDFKIKDIKKVFGDDFLIAQENDFYTHKDITATDGVYISRIRKNSCFKNAIDLYHVSDNLRKGSAYTAYEVAQKLFKL